MADLWTPPAIWLGENLTWDLELSLFEATDLLFYLTSHDSNSIRKYVLPRLRISDAEGVDKKRKEDEEEIEDEEEDEEEESGETGESGDESALLLTDDEIVQTVSPETQKARNRRGALKGLSMEMLTASILRHFDRCPRVVAWAGTKDGRPNTQAPKEHADVTAIFPRTSTSPEFRVLAEVSAKNKMSENYCTSQFSGGLTHAVAEANKHPGVPIIVLIVNGAEFGSDNKYQTLYRGFVSANAKLLAEYPNIRLIPMHDGAFAVVAARLCQDWSAENVYCSPAVFWETFLGLHEAVNQAEYPSDPLWMQGMVLDSIGKRVSKLDTPVDTGKGRRPRKRKRPKP